MSRSRTQHSASSKGYTQTSYPLISRLTLYQLSICSTHCTSWLVCYERSEKLPLRLVVIIYNISVSEGNKGSAFNWLILAVCPTPSSSNTLIATLKTRPEVTVILNVCLKAFSYHPELPGGSVQTTTFRKNPTPGGAWSQYHHELVCVLTTCSNHHLHTLQSPFHFLNCPSVYASIHTL